MAKVTENSIKIKSGSVFMQQQKKYYEIQSKCIHVTHISYIRFEV